MTYRIDALWSSPHPHILGGEALSGYIGREFEDAIQASLSHPLAAQIGAWFIERDEKGYFLQGMADENTAVDGIIRHVEPTP